MAPGRTEEEARQLEALLGLQERYSGPADQQLIHSPGVVIDGDIAAGIGDRWGKYVQLESGQRGYFTPLAELAEYLSGDPDQDHEALRLLLNRCAAWQLARELGPTYQQIVRPCVWREFDIGGDTQVGVLSLERPGDIDTGLQSHEAAALFDTLIGHQERTGGDFLWDNESQTLTLVNNAYAFPPLGDYFYAGRFTRERFYSSPALTEQELADLRQLLSGGGVERIKELLPRDRGVLFEARVRGTLDLKEIPRPDWPVLTPDQRRRARAKEQSDYLSPDESDYLNRMRRQQRDPRDPGPGMDR